MNTWNQKLIQLETRLQTLVEGSAARLFPREDRMDLPSQMLKAMKSTIHTEEDGRIIAPNLYLIKVNPTDASNLLENQSALIELALIIQQAGLEAGLYFNGPPLVKISPDPMQASQQISIEAKVTPPDLGKTKTLTQELPREASESIPPNAFLIVDGTSVFPLNQTVVNIGRRVDNHLTIEDPRVSRRHAQLRAIRGHFVLFDLNSTGGTFINGERITKRTLQPGDVISLAGIPLVFGQDSFTLSGDTHGSTHPIVPHPEEN